MTTDNPTFLEKLKQQRWIMWVLIPLLVVLAVFAGAFNPWPTLLPGLAGGVEESHVVVIERRETKREEKSGGTQQRQTATRRRVVETFDGGTRTTDEWINDLTRNTHFASLNLDETIDTRREETRKPSLERYSVGLLGGALWTAPTAVAPAFAVTGGVRLGNWPVWAEAAVIVVPSPVPSVGVMGGARVTFK